MSVRSYYIDFVQITKELLPHFLRQKAALGWVTTDDFFWITADGQAWGTGEAGRHLAWLQVLVSPLGYLNGVFRTFVGDTRYQMYLTGQVIYLEHYLNDLYDPVARRIYIEDGDAAAPFFVDNKPDATPTHIYNKSESQVAPVLYNKADLANQNDFVVVIPWQNIASLSASQMRAHVTRYKQAGKRFSIQPTPGGPPWPTSG